ncbi:MAG TPA: hypothetical protein PLQ89_20865 [Phycisphaerae bacterium]|nr:hypothetical protein [Phycisphaerae bacterium]
MSDKPKLLPLAAMARRVFVAPSWLRSEAEAGRIPHLQAGRTILFDPDAVEAVLLERARAGTAEPVPSDAEGGAS